MKEHDMSELARIKKELSILQERVARIEAHATSAHPLDQKKEVVSPTVQQAPAAGVPNQTKARVKKEKKKVSFEARIGKTWLNRLGIVTLIVGIAFFIGYTARHFIFSPMGRCLGGLSVSAVLIFMGRQFIAKKNLKHLGMSLCAGGWATFYFLTYAMYHLDSLKVINSVVVDFVLLAAIVGGIITESLRYRSKALLVIAYSLGFLTIALYQTTHYSLIAGAILAFSLIAITYYKRWKFVSLLGLLGVYGLHFIWYAQQIYTGKPYFVDKLIFASESVGSFFVGGWTHMLFVGSWHDAAMMGHVNGAVYVGFLLFYFALFFIGPYCLARREGTMNTTTTFLTLGNVYLFTSLIQPVLAGALAPWVWIAILSLIYMGRQLFVDKVWGAKNNNSVDLVLGLFLVTYALALGLSGVKEVYLFAFEAYVLTEISFQSRRRIYRPFAMSVMGITLLRYVFYCFDQSNQIVLWGLSEKFCIGAVIGFISVVSSIRLYLRSEMKEKSVVSALYSIIASIAWTMAIGYQFGAMGQVVAFVIMSVVASELSCAIQNKVYRVSSIAALFFGLFSLMDHTFSGHWHEMRSFLGLSLDFWMICVTSGLLCITSQRYKSALKNMGYVVYLWMGLLFLFFAVCNEFASDWFALVWGGEALLLIVLGFALREKQYRYGGMLLFVLVLIKLFFHDIAGLETIYKIISFIGLGVILLVASFLYSKSKEFFLPED